jgi:16S rRNA (uracil1498-N3)-methyltransferase
LYVWKINIIAMNIFYKPGEHLDIIQLDKSESHHCLNVLRLKEGDLVGVINGRGKFYNAVLVNKGHFSAALKIKSVISDYDKNEYHLHIAIAPTKNIDRFEWFLEKCTEIGVSEITPLLCMRSQRRKLRTDRMEKLLVSAIKQSDRATLPILNQPAMFSEFISKSINNSGYIAHCSDKYREHLISSLQCTKQVIVLIGPEGDFSPEEIDQAISKGYKPVSLGNHRLRTETAGIAVAQIVSDYYVIKGYQEGSS